MGFYHVVTTIATIVLILCLTFTGYMLWKSMHKSTFPPTTSNCPDYWTPVQGEKDTCENVKGLGKCCTEQSPCNVTGYPTRKHFSGHYQNQDKGPCRKKKWADECHIEWNGYTNNESVCDIKS